MVTSLTTSITQISSVKKVVRKLNNNKNNNNKIEFCHQSMFFGKSVSRGLSAMKNSICICILIVLCRMMSVLVSSHG